jgi:hypothetical protein
MFGAKRSKFSRNHRVALSSFVFRKHFVSTKVTTCRPVDEWELTKISPQIVDGQRVGANYEISEDSAFNPAPLIPVLH